MKCQPIYHTEYRHLTATCPGLLAFCSIVPQLGEHDSLVEKPTTNEQQHVETADYNHLAPKEARVAKRQYAQRVKVQCQKKKSNKNIYWSRTNTWACTTPVGSTNEVLENGDQENAHLTEGNAPGHLQNNNQPSSSLHHQPQLELQIVCGHELTHVVGEEKARPLIKVGGWGFDDLYSSLSCMAEVRVMLSHAQL